MPKSNNALSNLIEKIKNILDSGKVYAPDNRCWWTVYLVWKKLKKEEREHVKFVEGKMDGGAHYWLEVGSKIVDPHFYIIDNLSDIEVESPELYVAERRLNLEDAIIDLESYDERFCQNKKGKQKWMKVGIINFSEKKSEIDTSIDESSDTEQKILVALTDTCI